MEALGFGGSSWWNNKNHDFNEFLRQRRQKEKNKNKNYKASNSNSNSNSIYSSKPNNGFKFPIKQALTAASLAFAGDTIAQLRHHWSSNPNFQDIIQSLLSDHDWIRALRMTSYGFLFYGPGSYVWYQTLDRFLPQPTVNNLLLKVFLNQIILGPAVIAVVFAWNNLWQGKSCELPGKYQKDALPTLLVGFRFWIPYSVLNFWVIPLHARVAFMSLGSIFWNFVLSSTVSK